VLCPKCGSPTNHQAEKLVYPTTREEEEAVTAHGWQRRVIEEVFACPNCGWIASRRGAVTDVR
jgi:predicted RNA-binding Zn-ribbon protein involved in translation (DUF1610 family)